MSPFLIVALVTLGAAATGFAARTSPRNARWLGLGIGAAMLAMLVAVVGDGTSSATFWVLWTVMAALVAAPFAAGGYLLAGPVHPLVKVALVLAGVAGVLVATWVLVFGGLVLSCELGEACPA